MKYTGGIQAMLAALSNAKGMDSDVIAAVLSGIGSLASKGSAAEQIVAAGGVRVALDAMTTHVASSSVARSCVDLLRVFRDTHPDKLRALGADADAGLRNLFFFFHFFLYIYIFHKYMFIYYSYIIL